MIFKYKTYSCLQTRTHRLLGTFSHTLREGVWRDVDGKDISYSNCPTNHKIVAPYESFMWEN